MPTKAEFDADLVDRTQNLLPLVGMSVVTDGTNPNTVGPLGWAFRILKLTPETGVTPTDTDLALITVKQYFDLLDLAEYKLLGNIESRFTKSRIQIGANSIYNSDLRDALLRRIALLAADLKARFGLGLAKLTGGTLPLHNDTTADSPDPDAVLNSGTG